MVARLVVVVAELIALMFEGYAADLGKCARARDWWKTLGRYFLIGNTLLSYLCVLNDTHDANPLPSALDLNFSTKRNTAC